MAALAVKNFVDLCKADKVHPRQRRIWEKVSTQVIHRIDDGKTARDIWRFFLDKELGTGGKMPYHFVIEEDGSIVQCVNLCTVAPGAVKLNPYGIQIAVIGDFRKAPPLPDQYTSLLLLCATLYRNEVRSIVGHTEYGGATATPGKVCPGKHLDMDVLRDRVRQAVVGASKDLLVQSQIGM